jgi:hypothetical protein
MYYERALAATQAIELLGDRTLTRQIIEEAC